MPDGNFTTCPYPNPEIKEALQLGLDMCEKVKPDLLLATILMLIELVLQFLIMAHTD